MTNKAVLCGINNYKTITDLRGCLNDVQNIFELLTQVYNFEPSQIHQLIDEQVTKAAIENEYNWLLQEAQKGDRLVFHFSGHGSYVPDDNGYVHGISQHRHGYSNGWWNALKRFVGDIFGNGDLGGTRQEVLWSDLVNARALVDESQQQQLRREIELVLEERRTQTIAANTKSCSYRLFLIAPAFPPIMGDLKNLIITFTKRI